MKRYLLFVFSGLIMLNGCTPSKKISLPKQPEYFKVPCDIRFINSSSFNISLRISQSEVDDVCMAPGETGLYVSDKPFPNHGLLFDYVCDYMWVYLDDKILARWYPIQIKDRPDDSIVNPIRVSNYNQFSSQINEGHLLFEFVFDDDWCQKVVTWYKKYHYLKE